MQTASHMFIFTYSNPIFRFLFMFNSSFDDKVLFPLNCYAVLYKVF
jgi:hypothetical protein